MVLVLISDESEARRIEEIGREIVAQSREGLVHVEARQGLADVLARVEADGDLFCT